MLLQSTKLPITHPQLHRIPSKKRNTLCMLNEPCVCEAESPFKLVLPSRMCSEIRYGIAQQRSGNGHVSGEAQDASEADSGSDHDEVEGDVEDGGACGGPEVCE